MNELTEQQKHTLNLLRQRGMWITAQAAEQAWRQGERYYLDNRVCQDSHLRGQFMQGNDTAAFGRRRCRQR